MKTPFHPALFVALCLFLFVPAAPAVAQTQVKVGSKNFTEQVVLGEMITQLLRYNGLRAEHRAELGGTQVMYQALKSGELDVYVEYTGTLTQELFAGRKIRDDEALRRDLARDGLILGGKLGFANNYAIGVRGDVAETIKSIADLKKEASMRIGVSDEFMGRADGWPAVRSRYGLTQVARAMNHEVALRGLVNKSLEVTDLYTTDPEIRQYGFRLLEDELGALSVYHAVILYRADLETRVPGAIAALRSLEGRIDTAAMREMNAQVRVDRVAEPVVAAEFLRETLGLDVPTPQYQSRFARLARGLVVNTLQHVLLVTVSLVFAIALAVPLGVWAYRQPRWGGLILGGVGVVQTIPSMALLVFLIPLLGLGTWPALVALLLYSLLPIVRNTYTGLTGISPPLLESAQVLGLPSKARLWRIELPLASRSILAGVKTAAVINVGTATIGAIVGAGGYGQAILSGIRLNDVLLILSGAVPAAVLAVVAQQMVGWLEPLVVPRGLRVG